MVMIERVEAYLQAESVVSVALLQVLLSSQQQVAGGQLPGLLQEHVDFLQREYKTE